MSKQYTLPKDFAEKWVKSLRSGEYKQGINKLCSKEGYCCLGVAGSMMGVKDFGNAQYFGYKNKDHDIFLDVKGIPEELKGAWTRNDLVMDLTSMNDRLDSFSQIADWIEQNVDFV